jgi:hypothetical protein
VGAERGEIGDAVPAGGAGETAGGGECLQGGEPAGAGAADDAAVGVDAAALGEEAGERDTVLHVEDAPLAVEPGAVGAAVTGTAPVIDGDEGEAAAGEELGTQLQVQRSVAGQTGMRLRAAPPGPIRYRRWSCAFTTTSPAGV